MNKFLEYPLDGSAITNEFSEADLGHVRTERRLESLGRLLATSPAESFPKLARSDGELEAIYRFFGNDAFDAASVLEPHVDATSDRVSHLDRALILHDTSEFQFSGKRKGLGPLKDNNHRGFLGHFALAATWGRKPKPLGVLGFSSIVRKDKPEQPYWSTLPKSDRDKRRKKKRTADARRMRSAPRAEKESSRWEFLAKESSSRVNSSTHLVHVMDEESDDYALWAELVSADEGFVSRCSSKRLLEPGVTLQSELQQRQDQFARDVQLSKRAFKCKTDAKRHPSRYGRIAELHTRAVQVVIPKPPRAQSVLPSLTLNVVQVFEPKPPTGAEPIQWTLITTEPIETHREVMAIVDAYCARWLIEEFFKALKTGCSYEKRQLESLDALLKALMVFIPIAWHLLVLRVLARFDPEAPAHLAFSEDQLHLLRTVSRRVKLPRNPTMRQAMLAIAGIGGHIKNNGDPGWIVLARGYREFQILEAGWRAARSEANQQKF